MLTLWTSLRGTSRLGTLRILPRSKKSQVGKATVETHVTRIILARKALWKMLWKTSFTPKMSIMISRWTSNLGWVNSSLDLVVSAKGRRVLLRTSVSRLEVEVKPLQGWVLPCYKIGSLVLNRVVRWGMKASATLPMPVWRATKTSAFLIRSSKLMSAAKYFRVFKAPTGAFALTCRPKTSDNKQICSNQLSPRPLTLSSKWNKAWKKPTSNEITLSCSLSKDFLRQI